MKTCNQVRKEMGKMNEESSKKEIFSFVWKEFCKKRKEKEATKK